MSLQTHVLKFSTTSHKGEEEKNRSFVLGMKCPADTWGCGWPGTNEHPGPSTLSWCPTPQDNWRCQLVNSETWAGATAGQPDYHDLLHLGNLSHNVKRQKTQFGKVGDNFFFFFFYQFSLFLISSGCQLKGEKIWVWWSKWCFGSSRESHPLVLDFRNFHTEGSPFKSKSMEIAS